MEQNWREFLGCSRRQLIVNLNNINADVKQFVCLWVCFGGVFLPVLFFRGNVHVKN